MRVWLRGLATLAGALVLVTAVGVRNVKASPIPFATLQSIPGTPTIFFDFTTLGLSTIDLPNAYASDPLNPAAPVTYTQLSPSTGPLPALMTMAPIAAASSDSGHIFYGPGSFLVGVVGTSQSIPVLLGSFSSAVLNIGDGTLSNLDGTTLSGFGFQIAGLGNPGSFAFQLGNPVSTQTGLAFEITNGAFFAEPVPEPASLLLLASGALFLLVALKRRRLAWAINDRRA